jgi:hypothetical protein
MPHLIEFVALDIGIFGLFYQVLVDFPKAGQI